MKQTIFREKSLEGISSPEQSDTCIRIRKPGIRLLILAVILLFIALSIGIWCLTEFGWR